MECLAAAASGVVSKIGEYVVKLIINQGRYLCSFNSIVTVLQEEEDKLTRAKDDIKERVAAAKRNTQIIYKEVEKWQSDATKILEEVEGLRKEIEEKKSCLSGCCPNCWCRYWLGRKAARKTSDMLKLRENKFDSVGNRAPLPTDTEFSPPRGFELFQSSKSVFEQIMKALKDDEINLVGLYGMGGTGKTTLAKAVGCEVVKERMFDEAITVVLSQTPNFKDIQAGLAESLGLKLEEEAEDNRAKRLYKRFTGTDPETGKKQETSKKILVILDDVWKKFDLKTKLGIPSDGDHKGHKILLTTRLKQICLDMNCQNRTELNVLKEDEGVALLKRHAGIVDELPNNLRDDVVVEVAEECGGLPLALVAIGSALKEKEIYEWDNMHQKLKNSKLEDLPYTEVAGERGIYATLKVSYDYLMGEKTKRCFLLCSLFPEDYAIDVEELLRYAIGLGWYQDNQSIREARNELLSTLNHLKASGLLVDAYEGSVKMHDMVRDVALWIASKGENVFMSKVGMEQVEWSEKEDWERFTAISLMENKIEELSISLVCPKLEILILGGESSEKILKVSGECFKEMKALKVLSLRYVYLTLKSLQFLTNLKTLRLSHCNTRDISYVEQLDRLEILWFNGPLPFDELPRQISELRNLRLLYLGESVIIPSNALRRCSKLEELYALDEFWRQNVEETRTDKSNASLVDVTSLSRLSTLCLSIYTTCLPKDLAFPQLQRYVICVNNVSGWTSYKRALKIRNIKATSLITFKALYGTLEYLCLENATGCKNIVKCKV